MKHALQNIINVVIIARMTGQFKKRNYDLDVDFYLRTMI